MNAFSLLSLVVFCTLFIATAGASAQDLMPAQAALSEIDIDETHPPVKLTPDKSELIHLDKAASSIIVGNPLHLSVVMDNTKLLILVPKEPGATHMTILDAEGNIIMQRHVLVASPQKKYVRIRRSCAGDSSCEETSVYYCPGICHKVLLNTDTKKSKSKSEKKEEFSLAEDENGEDE